MKRAVRRHHRRRIIKKWYTIGKAWDFTHVDLNLWAKKVASIGSLSCGKCYGCVNPRTRNELTIQEIKASINEQEYLQEL